MVIIKLAFNVARRAILQDAYAKPGIELLHVSSGHWEASKIAPYLRSNALLPPYLMLKCESAILEVPIPLILENGSPFE
jgi:hypothetical protein